MSWVKIWNRKELIYRVDKGVLVLGGAAQMGDVAGVPAFLGRRSSTLWRVFRRRCVIHPTRMATARDWPRYRMIARSWSSGLP
jgi:hypothetical protein